jgi:hypothetical protein
VANHDTSSSTLLLDSAYDTMTMLKLINPKINCLQFRVIPIFFIHLEIRAYGTYPMNYKFKESAKHFQSWVQLFNEKGLMMPYHWIQNGFYLEHMPILCGWNYHKIIR